jgi:alginate O-acetyltransferase complex protein AlgI
MLVVVLPMLVMTLRAKLLPWVFMWMLAVAIFAGCKWRTGWEAHATFKGPRNWRRSVAYLLLWPGMEAQEFFENAAEKKHIPTSEWFAGVGKTLSGIALIWVGARVVSLGHPLLGGWVGMVGLVLLLHFGTFHLIALAWQRSGIPIKPIMQRPLASQSLSELWGKRWNLGYRKLSHTLVFLPLQKRFGLAGGTLGAFLASGLLHDLVISVPAGAGYGLPTAYFLAQGLGVLIERSQAGRRFGLGRGTKGRLWTAVIAIGPLYALFHPWFVMRVIVPFLSAIAG